MPGLVDDFEPCARDPRGGLCPNGGWHGAEPTDEHSDSYVMTGYPERDNRTVGRRPTAMRSILAR